MRKLTDSELAEAKETLKKAEEKAKREEEREAYIGSLIPSEQRKYKEEELTPSPDLTSYTAPEVDLKDADYDKAMIGASEMPTQEELDSQIGRDALQQALDENLHLRFITALLSNPAMIALGPNNTYLHHTSQISKAAKAMVVALKAEEDDS